MPGEFALDSSKLHTIGYNGAITRILDFQWVFFPSETNVVTNP